MTFIVYEAEILHKLSWIFLITDQYHMQVRVSYRTNMSIQQHRDDYRNWYIYTMELFSALKMNEIVVYRKMGVTHDNHMK